MEESPSEDPLHRLNRRAFIATGAAVGVAGCTDVFGDDETEIADWNDLAAVWEDLDGEYALVTDLDARTAGYDEHVGDPAREWAPTGEYDSEAATEFTSAFDGRGNEIADLRIDRPEIDSVGLFGTTEGTIESVGLVHPEVTGTGGVGGLAGELTGGGVSESITRGGTIAGEFGVGGLIGDVVNRNEVSASFVRGATVTGETAVGASPGTTGSGAKCGNRGPQER